jgi:hypothetical protein
MTASVKYAGATASKAIEALGPTDPEPVYCPNSTWITSDPLRRVAGRAASTTFAPYANPATVK